MSSIRSVREICMGQFIEGSKQFSGLVSTATEALNASRKYEVIKSGIEARELALRAMPSTKQTDARLRDLRSEKEEESRNLSNARARYEAALFALEETKALLLHLKLKIEEQEQRAVAVPAPLLSECESALSSFSRARTEIEILQKEP